MSPIDAFVQPSTEQVRPVASTVAEPPHRIRPIDPKKNHNSADLELVRVRVLRIRIVLPVPSASIGTFIALKQSIKVVDQIRDVRHMVYLFQQMCSNVADAIHTRYGTLPSQDSGADLEFLKKRGGAKFAQHHPRPPHAIQRGPQITIGSPQTFAGSTNKVYLVVHGSIADAFAFESDYFLRHFDIRTRCSIAPWTPVVFFPKRNIKHNRLICPARVPLFVSMASAAGLTVRTFCHNCGIVASYHTPSENLLPWDV